MMRFQTLPPTEFWQGGWRSGMLSGLAIALTLSTVACGARPGSQETAGDPGAGQQQFVGLWEPQVEDESSPGLFFAGDGRAFFVSPDPAQKQAIEMDYELDTQANPMELDIILPGESDRLKGIVELSGPDEMRLDGAKEREDPRPESFSADAVVFKRTSTEDSLPNDVQIITKEMIQNMQRGVSQPQ